MFLAIAFVTAAAGLGFYLLNPKSFRHWKRRVWYEYQFQIVGTKAVVDDHLQKTRNKLDEVPDWKGRVVVITGGARGIGVEVIKVLMSTGAKVVMGVRSPDAARKVFRDPAVEIYELDVSKFASVRKFAELVSKAYPEINLLLNNAGIMMVPYALTEDGFESQFATNYLGHFLLGHLLMPNLKKAGDKTDLCSRIVNVSSSAHYPGKIFFKDVNMSDDYIPSAAYAQSKLAQIMYAKYLNDKLESEGAKVKLYSVHPGVVNTELFNTTPFAKIPWFMNLFFKTPKQGAVSILHCCFSPKLETRGGLYVSNCRQGLLCDYATKTDLQKALFDTSCQLAKIKEYGKV